MSRRMTSGISSSIRRAPAKGVPRASHDLQARILRDDFRQCSANSGGACDDENPESAQLASSRTNIVGPTGRSGSFRSAMLPSEWPRKRYPLGPRRRQRRASNLLRCVDLVEVDQQIAAKDDVHCLRGRIGLIHQVMVLERHLPPQIRDNANFITAGIMQKVALAQRQRYRTYRAVRIYRPLGHSQDFGGDVACEDFEAEAWNLCAQNSSQIMASE